MTEVTLRDSYGRKVNNLRVSLTEQCNFRCLYCLPPEGLSPKSPVKVLSREQILRFVRVACGMGITRIRLTGGEPLLRWDLPPLLEGLSRIPQLEDIALTTNGFHLKRLAPDLKAAGLHRINISLDSLDAGRFRAMTRSQGYGQVRAGLQAAWQLGFPLKVNVVVLRGMNDAEILPFVELALEYSISVRFLEFMPLCGSGWNRELVFPVREMRRLVQRRYVTRELARGDAPAQEFEIRDGQRRARVGFIGPLSEPFCDSCSRIRLTADGKIQPCLFSPDLHSVPLFEEEGTDQDIARAIQRAVWLKPRGSQYASLEGEEEDELYLEAYEGRETQNPLIHNIGG